MNANPYAELEGRRRLVPFQRVALAAAMSLAAINVLGVGAYATWTDTEADQVDIVSGTLGIVLGASGTTANRLDVAAQDIAPGDTISRAVDLTNDGSIDLASITLTTVGQNGTALYNGTDGLDLKLAECSVAWTETVDSNGAYNYACSGTAAYPIGTSTTYDSVQQTSRALEGVAALAPGETSHLLVAMTLPQSADNSYQGLSETIGFTFDAIQRDGTAK